MRALVLALASTALFARAAAAGPRVTIYTHDLGYVRETRSLQLHGGVDTVRLENVSRQLDFSSLQLEPAAGRVGRLAYRWDVASGDDLVDRARGQRVRVISRGDRVTEGTLISADGNWLVVRGADGGLSTLAHAAVEAVQLAQPPAALALRPAVEAVIEGGRGPTDAQLSYLTAGLSWTAEHMLVRTGENRGMWSARVQIVNDTGRGFEDATVKLVAGEPSRVSSVRPRPEPMMKTVSAQMLRVADEGMSEAPFAEYHVYSLRGPATLRDRETQSLVMLDPRPVTFSPRYLYSGGDARGVRAQLELLNSAKDGPGAPLPAGRVRIFQADDSGAQQFTGESTIGHTPVDEKLTLEVGYAFDLAAERKTLAERRPSDREREYDVEIKLRNRKSVPVTILVDESVGGDTVLLKQSHPSTRKDANTIRFSIDIAPGKEAVLTYTARQRW
jgi:hypothetical protein